MFCADIIGPIKRRVIRELEETGQIGHEEKNWETVMPYTTYQFTEAETEGTVFSQFEVRGGFDTVKDGDTCRVVLDDKSYICQASVDDIGSRVTTIIGNNGEDMESILSGPPFMIFCNFNRDLPTDRSITIIVIGGGELHSISLEVQRKTIHPISDKYLPGPKHINLAEWGLEPVLLNDTEVTVVVDNGKATELIEAIKYGLVKLTMNIDIGARTERAMISMNTFSAPQLQAYACGSVVYFNGMAISFAVYISSTDNTIRAFAVPL